MPAKGKALPFIFAICAGVLLRPAPGAAQAASGTTCIVELHRQYAASSALRASCDSEADCLYQAPIGNASAVALLLSMIGRVEACWREAGFVQSEEEREPQGTVLRTYGGPGGAVCKLRLSFLLGQMPSGFRAACQ